MAHLVFPTRAPRVAESVGFGGGERLEPVETDVLGDSARSSPDTLLDLVFVVPSKDDVCRWVRRWASSGVVVVVAVACGPERPTTTDGVGDGGDGTNASDGDEAADSASGPGDAGMATAGDGSDGVSDSGVVPEVCKEGWTFCEECTLLSADHANCGECGHGCEGSSATQSCRNGQCQPGSWPCVTPDQGAVTCNDACATVGQMCSDDAETCGQHVKIWLTDSADENTSEDDLESCQRQVGADTSEQQPCNAPIPWDLEFLGRTVVGVACCCTQP